MNYGLFSRLLAQATEAAAPAADAVKDAAATATTEATQAASAGTPLWMIMLVVLAILILPFVVGQWIANALRVRDMANRIGTVLLSIVIGFTPFVVHKLTTGLSLVEVFNYGIDLGGGSNMTFAVDQAAAKASKKDVTPAVMQQMSSGINKRINPSGTEEIVVRPVGEDRIEVIIPGADAEKTQRIKNQITNLGDLEFSLLANRIDNQDLIDEAERQQRDKGTGVREIYNSKGQLIGKWREPGKLHTDNTKYKDVDQGPNDVVRTVERNGKQVTEFLINVEPNPERRITGKYLTNCSQETDERGSPAVAFEFNGKGGALFSNLTSRHLPKDGANGFKTRLAILLNDEIHSAPQIISQIGSRGQITGQFSQTEIDELIAVLNAGALSVPLLKEPASEFTISPLLGEDIRDTGLTATFVAMVAVFAITAIYYQKAGIIACLCLALNLLLLLSSMALIDATLTLPGIAGVVLSVAMAVDSNVLIFERMREELERGSSMRMCIKNGFDKALGTIIDSNLTTLISAVVLYYIGTDQVKGFAVTLFIGIVISMFTTVYVARVIFELLERTGNLKTLKMFAIIKQTNFNFVTNVKYFIYGSQIVILAGLLLVAFRGKDNLDIDFRGGAMITFQFEGDKSHDIEAVRAPLAKKFGEGISLERLEVPGEGSGTVELFRMRTVIDQFEAKAAEGGAGNVETQLRNEMRTAFEGGDFKLLHQTLTLGEATTIAATTEKLDETAMSREKSFEGGQQFVATVSQALTPTALAESVGEVLREIDPVKYAEIISSLDVKLADTAAAPGTAAKSLLVRLANNVTAEEVGKVRDLLVKKLDGQPLFAELTTFQSSVAGDTQIAAIMALLIALVAITIYLWFRFSGMTFGIAATIALFHDVFFTLGAIAVGAYLSGNPLGRGLYLIDFKINLTMVAAFLTIIGYSLNDTIVVFDRIREVRGKNPKITWEMINISLNQTLSRTLLTSVTTIITSTILYFFGGEGLRGFAYSLTLGILVGTYSSIYIASPALIWLTNRQAPEPAAKPAGLPTGATAR